MTQGVAADEVPLTGGGQLLLERSVELARLRDAVQGVRKGGGRSILLEGPAGVGKTTLLAAFAGSLEGVSCLRASGGEIERELPMIGIRELLAPALDALDPDQLASVLAGPAQAAGRVALGQPIEVLPDAGLATPHSVYWLISNLAEIEPLVLIVDDAHQLDRESLRALAYSARRIGGLPAILLLGRRSGPEGDVAELDRVALGPGLARVSLQSLSPDGSAKLIRARLPAATDDFCLACHQATDGSPHLLTELLLAVTERGLTPDGRGAEQVARIVPETIRGDAASRLARLPEPAQRLAWTVAVLGRAEVSLAAELSGLDRAEAEGAASTLVAAGSVELTVDNSLLIDISGPDNVGTTNPDTGGVVNVLLSHSNFEGVKTGPDGPQAATLPSENGNQSDPEKLAPGSDFLQAADSPTVDAGTGDGLLGATDVEGQHRSQGPSVDIGADELPVAPEVSFTAPSPPDGHPTNAGSLSYGFTSSEDDISGYTCTLFRPGASFGLPESCSSPRTISGFTQESTEGTYRFSVQATDSDGDSDSASRTFTYDVTAPETLLTETPGATSGPDPSFGFDSDEPSSSFRCRVDAGAWGPCTSPHGPGPLAEGAHSFEVEATDQAGNADPSPASHSFTVVGDSEQPADPADPDPTDPGDPADPAPGDPTSPADTTAPTLTLSGKRKQSSPKKVKVKASCDEACTVVVKPKGKAKISGSASNASTAAKKKLKMKPARAELEAGASRTLKLKFKGKKAKKQVKRALKRGKRIKLKLVAKATDEAGNRSSDSFKVKVKK